MPKTQSKTLLAEKILFKGTKGDRRAFFGFNNENTEEEIRIKFLYWAKFLFPKFFSSVDADFHRDIDEGNIKSYKQGLSFLNIAFRGSAKTTRTKLFVAFAIANDLDHYRKYFKVLSKDLGNAKQSTTDVYNMLVTPRVKDLYPEIFQKTEAKREETMASFTTATGVKMLADTIGTDQRGDIQDESRPDFVWYDDFETRLSLMSAVITNKIWQNMEEAKNGLAKGGASVYTCNYISERGNVHKLVGKIKNQIIIPIERNGEPTWVHYNKDDIVKIKQEAEDYAGEYLCCPSASKDVYFDRDKVNKQTPIEIKEEIAGLKIFSKFRPENRIVGGSDVGGGVGLDHSTAVYIDLDSIPAQVIATYKNNEIKPDAFAHVLVKQGKRFGECYIAVENNYGSTVDILKGIYPTNKIHKTQRPRKKINFQPPVEYGWNTNSATKPTMLADLNKAVEDGLIELNDSDLISEVRSFTMGDLMDREVDPRLTTRHFDLLMACAIAWAVRAFVKKPPAKKVYNSLDAWTDKQKLSNPAI